MPGIMDILGAATSSVMPRKAIQGLQEAFSPGSSAEIEGGIADVPAALQDILANIGEYPGEIAGGFMSGALEGARGEVNPANIAGLAIPGLVGAFRGAGAVDDVARAIPKYGRQAFDVVDSLPTRQVNPSMSDVDAIIADSMRMQAKVPSATGTYRRPGAPASQMPPEFVPRGGEAAYNAGRPPSIGPDINMPPAPPMAARRTGLPIGTIADPVGDRLAEIENALRSRYNQGYPGMGRGPR